jgi:hypothetical protein
MLRLYKAETNLPCPALHASSEGRRVLPNHFELLCIISENNQKIKPWNHTKAGTDLRLTLHASSQSCRILPNNRAARCLIRK